MNKRINLGIVGHGFVGRAVDQGFTENVHKIIIDPKYDDKGLEGLTDVSLAAIFVCVPTPARRNGEVNDGILLEVIKEISSFSEENKRRPLVIVKSTAPPATFEELQRLYPPLIYNPEFLKERSAIEDFLNPPMHVFGGEARYVNLAENLYLEYSSCAACPIYKMDIKTASLLKYTLNCFLATKVIFFNQLRELHQACGAESTWEEFIKLVATDKRMGNTHMHVPGLDGEWGYAGSCFPKDMGAFVQYAASQRQDFQLLRKVMELNEKYRRG